MNLNAAGGSTRIEEVAADKGYHAAATLELCDSYSLRTYIPEPTRKYDWMWNDKPSDYQRCVYNNRRRGGRAKSKELQRRRSEVCERTFAHICETGGMRRSWLRGRSDVAKRYVIAAAAHNLSRIARALFGIGKPRGLSGIFNRCAFAQIVIMKIVALLNAILASFPHRAIQGNTQTD